MRRLNHAIIPTVRISIVGFVLYVLGAAAAASAILLPSHGAAHDRSLERTLTAVARSAAGNAAATAAATLETGSLLLAPQDTFLNINATNYSTETTLATDTWPDYQVADAIVMKFDFSSLPAGAMVQGATLNLAPLQSDTALLDSPSSILWSADHEEGNMSDWYTPSGGGEFNSGGGVSTASTDVAHSGRYSAKATISTPPSPSAVRLFRWKESRANPEAYYSAWFYFPRNYQPSWWNIDQFKSRPSSTADPDPFWFVQVGNRPNGNMHLYLTWWYGPWPNGTVEGPHQGEFGGKDYYQTIKDLPTNQWVHIEIFLRQSASFGGQIIVWQDGVEILKQNDVKTRYPYMGNEWALSNYSGSISPSPATIYFDDAAISTARLGPGTSDTTPPTVPTNLRIVQ